MSHPEHARPGSTPSYNYDRPAAMNKGTQIVTTIVLLILGYYVLSLLDAWPSTTKRTLYEYTIRAIPSRLIHVLQNAMVKRGRISYKDAASFSKDNYGDFRSKEAALQRMVGQSPIPQVFKRARTLSGFDKFIAPIVELAPPGLRNWDNSCYQNSVLQGLASLPAFHDYIDRSLLLCEKADVDRSTTAALASLVEQLADSSQLKSAIWPDPVLKSMSTWVQQDAQEYFTKVLAAVEKETIAYAQHFVRGLSQGYTSLPVDDSVQRAQDTNQSAKAVENFLQTVVQNPLAGMEASALECQTCGYSEGLNLTQFECLTLSLGLGGPCHLEHLLDAYTDAELLEGVECDRCTASANEQNEVDGEHPQDNRSAAPTTTQKPKPKPKPVLRTKAKQTTLARLPKDLIFHINRSIFNEYGEQRKNTSFVDFPARLNLQGRWCAPLDDDDDDIDTSNTVYELQAIVTHAGLHNDGHYVAFGRRDKDWFCFNDETVTKTSEAEVLRRGNVFMLFYEKVDHDEDALSEEDEGFEDARMADVPTPIAESDSEHVVPAVPSEHPESVSSTTTSGSEPSEASAVVPVNITIPTMRTAGVTASSSPQVSSSAAVI